MHTFLADNASNCLSFGVSDGYKDPLIWGTLPFTNNRDADCLTESNFNVIYDDLYSKFNDDVAIETYNHWACGWVSVIRVNMANLALVSAAEDWVYRLEDYPVACDDDFSSREYERQQEAWGCWLERDVQQLLQDNGLFSCCEAFEWKEGMEEKVKEVVYSLVVGEDCWFDTDDFMREAHKLA